MEKEQAAELFGVSGKHVQKFTTTTPSGNELTGFICKSRGSNMGSMILDTVNNKNTWQFVRGMPKIKYMDSRDEITTPTILSKPDGTNIVAFPLLDEAECVEVLFKTRLMPHANDGWMNKIQEVFTSDMYKAVYNENYSYSYELYGTHNKHEVQYQYLDIPELNMDLLCVLEQGKALPVADVNALAKKYNINEVMKVAITQDMGAEWMSILNPQFQNLYLEFMPTNDDVIVEKTVTDLYKSMELFFEKMNIKFQEKYKGGIITEGSVWHYGEDENHMLKCKALSVREGHIKQACGIPHEDIRKAIRKLEENSDEDLATQKIDKILSFVKDELLEEYDKQMVDDDKTEQKVKSVLGKYLKKVKIDDEMQQIVDRIHNEIGVEASPADKMRVFAELYPNMRKRSGTVYQALVSM